MVCVLANTDKTKQSLIIDLIVFPPIRFIEKGVMPKLKLSHLITKTANESLLKDLH